MNMDTSEFVARAMKTQKEINDIFKSSIQVLHESINRLENELKKDKVDKELNIEVQDLVEHELNKADIRLDVDKDGNIMVLFDAGFYAYRCVSFNEMIKTFLDRNFDSDKSKDLLNSLSDMVETKFLF
jgi:hypothetical protein